MNFTSLFQVRHISIIYNEGLYYFLLSSFGLGDGVLLLLFDFFFLESYPLDRRRLLLFFLLFFLSLLSSLLFLLEDFFLLLSLVLLLLLLLLLRYLCFFELTLLPLNLSSLPALPFFSRITWYSLLRFSKTCKKLHSFIFGQEFS